MTNPPKALCSACPDLARWFWETNSVIIRPERPFLFASDLLSPIYTDCRRLLSFPQAVQEIAEGAVAILENAGLLTSFDLVAGGETAGIPYAAILAYRLRLPMVYVRKQPKQYGTRSRIEGVLTGGSKSLLFEDLVSDGSSKLGFVNALRESGASVSHCLVLFEYGLPDCRRVLAANGIELVSLVDCKTVLEQGLKLGLVNSLQARAVEDFLRHPQKRNDALII